MENLSEHKGGTSIEKYFSSDGLYKVISIGSYGLNNEYIDQGIRAVKNKTTESKLVRSGQLTMVLNDKTANGNLIGRCLLISKDNEFIVNQRTEIIIPGPDLNENYAYYYLNGPFRNKVKKIAQGGTQIYVNYSSVKRQKINYPIKNEQIKISKLLKIIKSLITLYERKLKLLSRVKKYFLDNLFAKKEYPNLRFKGFTDAWEQRKLENLSEHKGGTSIEKYFSSDGLYKVISIGSYGLNNEYIDQGIRAVKNKTTESKLVRSGQLTMVLNDKTANGNLIGRCLLISKDNEFIVNQRTEIIIPGPDLNENYAYYYLNGPFRNKVKKIAQGGTQIYVNYSSVKRQKINYPIKNEQIKISKLLKIIKSLITLYERKLKLLSRVKKYFLDNLFAKKEYPNLRFKGFTDAWKQRKLSSILIERKDLSTESKEFPLSSFIQEKGVVPKSQRYDRSFLVKDSSKKYKVTKFGDFIYSSNNLDTGSIGLNSYGNAVISPVYSVFSSKNLNVLETNFVNLLFQQNFYKNKMLRFRQGVMYGQLKIKEDDFLKIRVNVPSQTEIKNITNLFSKIELYATLLENKKKQLVQIKSILLNTMFI